MADRDAAPPDLAREEAIELVERWKRATHRTIGGNEVSFFGDLGGLRGMQTILDLASLGASLEGAIEAEGTVWRDPNDATKVGEMWEIGRGEEARAAWPGKKFVRVLILPPSTPNEERS